MTIWVKYRRSNLAEMRPYVEGEDLSDISVSQIDQSIFMLDRKKFNRGFIARNPKNHDDQWYVSRDYFDTNFEPIE